MDTNSRDELRNRRLGPNPTDSAPPPVRLAVGLGDPDLERRLLPALGEVGRFTLVERCLAADQLLACLASGRVEAALVALGLHKLSASLLGELARTQVPLVLLAAPGDQEACRSFHGTVLPLDADPASIIQALMAALRGELPPIAPSKTPREVEQEKPPPEAARPQSAQTTLVVASAHGSPGRTTVAVSLAAALGAVAPTILVDADLSGPSGAAHLDADPTRNLYMLAHVEPETPREWARAIDQEAQPLSTRCPHGVVLCGIPKPEMRGGISPGFFERLLVELQRRYRYVVLDVGAEFLGSEAAVHRSALGLAGQILLVSGCDLVSLWHTRTALATLGDSLRVDRSRLTLVLNRHDRRYHHDRTEIEWALGLPVAAVIPFDHGSAQRALAAQHPLVLEDRSRAGRALLGMAERLHQGKVALPPPPGDGSQARGHEWVRAILSIWPGARGEAGKGVASGEYASPVR